MSRQREPGLMFPKMPAKKKAKKHARQSIVQSEADRHRCMLCMWEQDYHERTGLHKHHVFMGPLRDMSEAEGFFVWLCPYHHTIGNESVHRDHDTCLRLQQYAQRKYEQTHTREDFVKLTGRSYL